MSFQLNSYLKTRYLRSQKALYCAERLERGMDRIHESLIYDEP